MSAGESLARLSSQVQAANQLYERTGMVDSAIAVNSTLCQAESVLGKEESGTIVEEEKKEGKECLTKIADESANQSEDHLPSKDIDSPHFLHLFGNSLSSRRKFTVYLPIRLLVD